MSGLEVDPLPTIDQVEVFDMADPVDVEIVTIDGEPLDELVEFVGGPPGRRGPQGTPGPGAVVELIAGAAVSGHRVVGWRSDGYVEHSSADSLLMFWSAAGISLNAAARLDVVQVVNLAVIEEMSWNWTPGIPVWCGVAGVLTQTPPAGNMRRQQVGVAIEPTSMWVEIQQPIWMV